MLTSKEFYKKKFDHVLLVSPSANKMDVPVHKDNMNQVFSIKWIEERLLEFNKKQSQRILQRLRDKGVIDKFDVKKLNGHLFDEIATDVTKNHPN
jgi:seryl-tRNA synthetase